MQTVWGSATGSSREPWWRGLGRMRPAGARGIVAAELALVVAIWWALLVALVVVGSLMVVSDGGAALVAAIVRGRRPACDRGAAARAARHSARRRGDPRRADGGRREQARGPDRDLRPRRARRAAVAANVMIAQLRDRGDGARSVRRRPPGPDRGGLGTTCARRSPPCACSPRRSATTSSRTETRRAYLRRMTTHMTR